jgi:ribosomal protein S18 acetylase RimI-like enzyme
MSDSLERSLAFLRTLDERCAERTERSCFGTAFFVDTLPRVWSLNFLAVDRGIAAGAGELAADADRVQGAAALEHRRLVVDDDRLGRAVAPGLRGLGWKAASLLVMPHLQNGRLADPSLAREVERETLDPVWAEGVRTEPSLDDPETVRQLVLQRQVVQRAIQTRYFAVVVGGRVASYCELYSDGETAQIEGVLTLPEFRRRGLASAVVARALTESKPDHELVFLLADSEDWPQELYRKLGFTPVGRCWSFVRSPSGERKGN